jgi:4-amino-4-deoxy-L-arabinose transferase-like glycosyltransferase
MVKSKKSSLSIHDLPFTIHDSRFTTYDLRIMDRVRIIFIAIFLLGAGVRAIDVWRPIDRPSWRECDVGAIARNYAREEMNFFYPRIDWRGDGAGYAEMEFPLFPFFIAIAYKIFGIHEFIGRLIAYLFSLGALYFFFQLARRFLSTTGAIAAALFFALAPLAVFISHALQPEGLMLVCYLAAVHFFTRWLDDEKRTDFLLAMFAAALALLSKITAGHIGILFAVLTLQKYGFGALRRRDVWLFAVVALLPAALWSWHARRLWLVYGNSLGVSNEYHWIGWDFFTDSSFIRNILRQEIAHVWTRTGLVLATCGVIFRWNSRAVKIALWWLLAIFVFYIVACRTTGDDWAFYYHIFSVAPAALLIGAGVEVSAKLFDRRKFLALSNIIGSALISIFALTLLVELRGIARDARLWNEQRGLFECAQKFAPLMREPGLIVASGGACTDEKGYPVAYNSSYFFYWTNRKGFNICQAEQSTDKLRSLAARGARYFIAEKSSLQLKPDFASELRAQFPMLAECKDAFLFELK